MALLPPSRYFTTWTISVPPEKLYASASQDGRFTPISGGVATFDISAYDGCKPGTEVEFRADRTITKAKVIRRRRSHKRGVVKVWIDGVRTEVV